MNNTCPHHSGIEAEVKSVCNKIDLRFDEVNRRLETLEKIIVRVGILEKGMGYREGSRHWTDYMMTVFISIAVMMILHYILKI